MGSPDVPVVPPRRPPLQGDLGAGSPRRELSLAAIDRLINGLSLGLGRNENDFKKAGAASASIVPKRPAGQ